MEKNKSTIEEAIPDQPSNGAGLVPHESGNQIAKAKPQIGFITADLDTATAEDLPNLDEATTIPFDLAGVYWTPEPEADSARTEKSKRNMFFSHIDSALVTNEETGEQKVLPTAHFVWRNGNTITTVRNASKRLLAAIENNNVVRGAGLEVTYLGKVRNTTNAFMSDHWKVCPKGVKAAI